MFICPKYGCPHFVCQLTAFLPSSHEHGHKEHKEHEHKEDAHEHKHGHDHDMKDEMPAWKKKALEAGNSDPSAAPFGGSWTTEASVSATDKMEE